MGVPSTVRRTLGRAGGKARRLIAPGPMSCRGLSHRELHTPDSSLHVQLLAPM